jgi:hypothetical protein
MDGRPSWGDGRPLSIGEPQAWLDLGIEIDVPTTGKAGATRQDRQRSLCGKARGGGENWAPNPDLVPNMPPARKLQPRVLDRQRSSTSRPSSLLGKGRRRVGCLNQRRACRSGTREVGGATLGIHGRHHVDAAKQDAPAI